MRNYSTAEILEGIRRRDREVLGFVYRKFYPDIKFLILNNSGNEDDAKDIFQEAIIVIYRKLDKEEFKLNCNFNTYLHSVCRLLWLKQLEESGYRNREKVVGFEDIVVLDDSWKETARMSERYRLFQKHFMKLGADCQKILQLYLRKVPLKQIAEMMGFKGEKYAKKRKHQCKEKLVSSIREDPEFKDMGSATDSLPDFD